MAPNGGHDPQLRYLKVPYSSGILGPLSGQPSGASSEILAQKAWRPRSFDPELYRVYCLSGFAVRSGGCFYYITCSLRSVAGYLACMYFICVVLS